MRAQRLLRFLSAAVVTLGVIGTGVSSLAATPAAAQGGSGPPRAAGQTVVAQPTATPRPTPPQNLSGGQNTTPIYPFPVPHCEPGSNGQQVCRVLKMACHPNGQCSPLWDPATP